MIMNKSIHQSILKVPTRTWTWALFCCMWYLVAKSNSESGELTLQILRCPRAISRGYRWVSITATTDNYHNRLLLVLDEFRLVNDLICGHEWIT